MAHPFHFRGKFLKRDVRRLTKAVVHLVFLFCGGGEQSGAARRAPEKLKSGGGNVKILLPETKTQGLAGSGEQKEAAAGGRRGAGEAKIEEIRTCR